MNALPRTHNRKPRRCAKSLICLVALAGVAEPARAATPSPAVAPRCPACVVAAPALIDLAGAAFIGATAGAAIEGARQAVERSEAVHTGARVAHHPRTHSAAIRWANANTGIGRGLWHHFHGKVGRIYRWLRGTYTLRKLKQKLPQAAVACVLSGTIAGIRTGGIRDAAWSCVGAALGVISSGKARPRT